SIGSPPSGHEIAGLVGVSAAPMRAGSAVKPMPNESASQGSEGPPVVERMSALPQIVDFPKLYATVPLQMGAPLLSRYELSDAKMSASAHRAARTPSRIAKPPASLWMRVPVTIPPVSLTLTVLTPEPPSVKADE